jgi:hypothetical protein
LTSAMPSKVSRTMGGNAFFIQGISPTGHS